MCLTVSHKPLPSGQSCKLYPLHFCDTEVDSRLALLPYGYYSKEYQLAVEFYAEVKIRVWFKVMKIYKNCDKQPVKENNRKLQITKTIIA